LGRGLGRFLIEYGRTSRRRARMDFLFVDETGDPSDKIDAGSSQYFGMALLHVQSNNYAVIRETVSRYRWLSGMFAELKKLPQKPIVSLNLLRGIEPLAKAGLIKASGIYIDKAQYGGRYLKWSDIDIPEHEWRYYLRNYVLRHLLEYHFSQGCVVDTVDLVLDRIELTEEQRINTLNYLNSSNLIPLRQPFGIPPIRYLTIADSEYVEALQIAHLLADLVKSYAKGTVMTDLAELSHFLQIAEFLGRKQNMEKDKSE
jgi:hypothetical protein